MVMTKHDSLKAISNEKSCFKEKLAPHFLIIFFISLSHKCPFLYESTFPSSISSYFSTITFLQKLSCSIPNLLSHLRNNTFSGPFQPDPHYMATTNLIGNFISRMVNGVWLSKDKELRSGIQSLSKDPQVRGPFLEGFFFFWNHWWYGWGFGFLGEALF